VDFELNNPDNCWKSYGRHCSDYEDKEFDVNFTPVTLCRIESMDFTEPCVKKGKRVEETADPFGKQDREYLEHQRHAFHGQRKVVLSSDDHCTLMGQVEPDSNGQNKNKLEQNVEQSGGEPQTGMSLRSVDEYG
jgi:hypothetical protein